MNDKERLGEIKEARKRILDEKSFQKKCILLNSFEELAYLDWLIEQAEKAERYENALKYILENYYNEELDDTGYAIEAQQIAKQALEGSE